jgi:hypothetical protein
LANMRDDLNAKIMQETGSAFEGNAARLSAEISKAGRDLDEMAAKGIDVLAGRDVLSKYSATMTEKYVKDQADALKKLQTDTQLNNAEITSDYVAAAEAQYQATLLSIKKQVEERRKASGNTTAVVDWEVSETKKAEQAKAQAVIDGENKKHSMRLQTLDFERQQGYLSAAVYRASYLAEVEAFIDSNMEKLKSIQQFSEQWRNIVQATADAIAQKHRLAGQEISTAWGEAIYRMDQDSYDYADRIKQTFDEMGNSISSALFDTIKGTGDGIKGLIMSLSDSILKMWMDMITQMYIMAPLKNMFSGILGGGSGGDSGGTCFLAGTMIETPTGRKPIEKINIGDIVISFDGESLARSQDPVIDTIKRVARGYFIIKIGNQYMNVTAEHPIRTINGWTKAGELTVGDVVHCFESTASVSSIEYVETLVVVYNLTVDGNHTYYANGIAVHNKIAPWNMAADGGYQSPGWVITGEEGPELINFSSPGRVYTANQTKQLLADRARMSGGSSGFSSGASGGNTIVMNITTPDANSFKRSKSQIAADYQRLLSSGQRNM